MSLGYKYEFFVEIQGLEKTKALTLFSKKSLTKY